MTNPFAPDLKEETLEDEWALGDYADGECPNCERWRLCKCANGKTRCEKCNWVVEDADYCGIKLHT